MILELPFCVGFIDGSHIILFEKPESDPEDYVNRKNDVSIQLQVTIDHEKKIRHFYVGFPGSVHDARVFSHTALYVTPNHYFSPNEYLIGNAAYKLTKRLVTPYRKFRGIIETLMKIICIDII